MLWLRVILPIQIATLSLVTASRTFADVLDHARVIKEIYRHSHDCCD